MRLFRIALSLLLAGFWLLAGQASAASITVNNFSFTDASLVSPGQFLQKCPDSWTCNAGFTGGVYWPVSPTQYNSANDGLPAGHIVPEGNTAAFDPFSTSSVLATISQNTSATIANNTIYTLTVWAGRRADSQGTTWATNTIELTANNVAIPSTVLVLSAPAQGFWKSYTVTYTASASDPLFGQTLGISLLEVGGGGASQTNWDDVTLDATATTPVPEPITMFLGGTGLLALGFAARRRLFGR